MDFKVEAFSAFASYEFGLHEEERMVLLSALWL